MAGMSGSARHSKGSKRELSVSKELSKWSGEHFMRTLQSGAGGTRAVDDLRMTGDIFAPLGSKNSFSYEVKDHKATTLENVFMNTGEIPSFWEQCTTDCRRVKKFGYSPMLIFHIDRRGDFVLMPYLDWTFDQLVKNNQRVAKLITYYTIKRTGVRYDFDTLLTNMDGLQSLDAQDTFKHYHNLNWDSKHTTQDVLSPEQEVDELFGKADK